MGSKELLELMNKGVAWEIQVSIQHMWQHVRWVGLKGFTMKDELKNISLVEMKHTESIAERLFCLGEKLTKVCSDLRWGNLKEMIENDKKADEETI